ncbi:hypothetical protein SeLEV6574_g06662 [Synchytrium endobioticum]|uniref:Uncharacterized protein n=1 Tax=Synchytrium endobioticum TaxID=286115 RepID=A0A507CKI9_9FUNG|nr:hypothetical protein SeLEV6574_g06662 [Synchytrium endobioticum]
MAATISSRSSLLLVAILLFPLWALVQSVDVPEPFPEPFPAGWEIGKPLPDVSAVGFVAIMDNDDNNNVPKEFRVVSGNSWQQLAREYQYIMVTEGDNRNTWVKLKSDGTSNFVVTGTYVVVREPVGESMGTMLPSVKESEVQGEAYVFRHNTEIPEKISDFSKLTNYRSHKFPVNHQFAGAFIGGVMSVMSVVPTADTNDKLSIYTTTVTNSYYAIKPLNGKHGRQDAVSMINDAPLPQDTPLEGLNEVAVRKPLTKADITLLGGVFTSVVMAVALILFLTAHLSPLLMLGAAAAGIALTGAALVMKMISKKKTIDQVEARGTQSRDPDSFTHSLSSEYGSPTGDGGSSTRDVSTYVSKDPLSMKRIAVVGLIAVTVIWLIGVLLHPLLGIPVTTIVVMAVGAVLATGVALLAKRLMQGRTKFRSRSSVRPVYEGGSPSASVSGSSRSSWNSIKIDALADPGSHSTRARAKNAPINRINSYP